MWGGVLADSEEIAKALLEHVLSYARECSIPCIELRIAGGRELDIWNTSVLGFGKLANWNIGVLGGGGLDDSIIGILGDRELDNRNTGVLGGEEGDDWIRHNNQSTNISNISNKPINQSTNISISPMKYWITGILENWYDRRSNPPIN